MKTLFGLIMIVLFTVVNIGKAVADIPQEKELQICTEYDVGITQMDVSVNVDLSVETGKSSFEFIYINKNAEISTNRLPGNYKNEHRQAKTKTIKENPCGYPLKYPFRDKGKRA